jgi:hypothetical protein
MPSSSRKRLPRILIFVRGFQRCGGPSAAMRRQMFGYSVRENGFSSNACALFCARAYVQMTAEELRQHRVEPLRDRALGPLYIPRRFTALPESGNLSSDLEFRAYGMLLEREPTLKEVLTHPSSAIVADPGADKSAVGRAAVEHLLAHGGPRTPTQTSSAKYRARWDHKDVLRQKF